MALAYLGCKQDKGGEELGQVPGEGARHAEAGVLLIPLGQRFGLPGRVVPHRLSPNPRLDRVQVPPWAGAQDVQAWLLRGICPYSRFPRARRKLLWMGTVTADCH